jgi:exodeoxyribonuclease VII large subunit
LVVAGGLNVYVLGGSLTLVVTQCELVGQGDLQQRLREIEARLRAEGVFDRPKRQLPRIPKKIAVIAALGGAALQDILEVTRKRAPGIDIMVFPASAQGESCVAENLMALQEAQDEFWGCDLIIMARGGGSIEDLWGFNDQELVRAVSMCRLPIITGVGHEIDMTLVDLASDRRAATPSQGAEIATPDRNMLLSELFRRVDFLGRLMDRRLQSLEATLNLLTDQGLMRIDPLEGHREHLDRLALRLERNAPVRRMDRANMRLSMLHQRLLHIGPQAISMGNSTRVSEYHGRLNSAMTRLLEQRARLLDVTKANLTGLNPEAPLSRGFVMVYNEEKRPVKSSAEVNSNAKLRLQWKDGTRWVSVD